MSTVLKLASEIAFKEHALITGFILCVLHIPVLLDGE